ncbi:tetratricopeptide repeat protein [Okeania sp. SIO1I7]|uniref:tetratricopeptide repeat protein n=1 Tax=Okeania sp. SIO1I7 TaxID=2607772 RepID=UPI0013F6C868|nr:tetratricopeptide repeat protein [Okeania sp. SIO1I7]NET28311.1 tetratricopeptide repeat protein [Okeania sp. SIO1I7]
MRIINMVEFCHKQMLKKLSKGLPKSISILIIVLILSISGNSAYSQGTKDKFNDNYQQENDLKLLSAFPKNPNLATHPIDSLLAQNQEQVADFKLKEEISIRVREEVDYTFRHATSLLSIFLILLTLFPASAAIWIWFLQTKLSNKIFLTEQEIESFKYDTISQLKEIVNEAQIILDELQQQSKQADEKIEQLQKDTLIQYSDAKTDNSEPLMMANDYAKQADKFFFAGRLKEAVSAYNQALKIHPEMADTWNNRGVVLTRLKMYDEAIVSYDRALQIRADYADAWNNRGVSLIELQHYQEAINSFEQAIKVKADYADAWNNRGVCLAKIQKYQEAVKSYNQAIAIKNNYSDAWNNRGVALMKLGIYGEAIACYDNAAKIKPDFFSAWYNKARCCVLKGEVEAGLKSLKKAINLNPSRCKEMAKNEPDFDDLRNNELFNKLID